MEVYLIENKCMEVNANTLLHICWEVNFIINLCEVKSKFHAMSAFTNYMGDTGYI